MAKSAPRLVRRCRSMPGTSNGTHTLRLAPAMVNDRGQLALTHGTQARLRRGRRRRHGRRRHGRHGRRHGRHGRRRRRHTGNVAGDGRGDRICRPPTDSQPWPAGAAGQAAAKRPPLLTKYATASATASATAWCCTSWCRSVVIVASWRWSAPRSTRHEIIERNQRPSPRGRVFGWRKSARNRDGVSRTTARFRKSHIQISLFCRFHDPTRPDAHTSIN